MAAVQQSLLDVPVAKPVKKAPRARKPKPQVAFNAPISYESGIDGDGRRTWTLTFPAPDKLVSANARLHWRAASPITRTWREAVYVHAKAAKLPKGLARIRVDIELRFPTGGRRDSANYYTGMKPTVDALASERRQVVKKGPRAGQIVIEPGYGLIVDDTPEFLDGPFIRVGPSGKTPGAPFGQVILTITDLGGGS